MFSNDGLLVSENRKYTYLENCPSKTEVKILATSNSGRAVRALTQAITKEKKHLIDKIFLKKSYSLLHLSMSLYIRAIVYLKKIFQKVKKFF